MSELTCGIKIRTADEINQTVNRLSIIICIWNYKKQYMLAKYDHLGFWQLYGVQHFVLESNGHKLHFISK